MALPIVGNFDPPVTAATGPDLGGQGEEDTGDFDGDGDTDGADFLSWQRSFSAVATSSSAASGDGGARQQDLEAWAANYGASTGDTVVQASSSLAASVAVPTTAELVTLGSAYAASIAPDSDEDVLEAVFQPLGESTRLGQGEDSQLLPAATVDLAFGQELLEGEDDNESRELAWSEVEGLLLGGVLS